MITEKKETNKANQSKQTGNLDNLSDLFFSRSGSRLSAMTKTYTDVDMVVELLQEKEHDLELAARIGQSLLEENQEQRRLNEVLEDQITSLLEQVRFLFFSLRFLCFNFVFLCLYFFVFCPVSSNKMH